MVMLGPKYVVAQQFILGRSWLGCGCLCHGAAPYAAQVRRASLSLLTGIARQSFAVEVKAYFIIGAEGLFLWRGLRRRGSWADGKWVGASLD